MSGFGSFSQEAYEQLRAAYGAQALRADEQEAAGVSVGTETLNVETSPVKNAWLDKTGLWQYPSGRGDYQDGEQKQEDLLAALRNEAGEIESDEEEDLDSMSDEEIDTMIDGILAEINNEDDETEGDSEEDAEDEVDVDDLTDEEFDKLVEELLAEIDEDLEEESEDGEDELSAQEISERIAQLKAELAALTSTEEAEEEEEEVEEEEVPEETQGEEEETVDDGDESILENEPSEDVSETDS